MFWQCSVQYCNSIVAVSTLSKVICLFCGYLNVSRNVGQIFKKEFIQGLESL